jgi:hypothetical protein
MKNLIVYPQRIAMPGIATLCRMCFIIFVASPERFFTSPSGSFRMTEYFVASPERFFTSPSGSFRMTVRFDV